MFAVHSRTGGIKAQRLSKDKNADWRPRDRVHSTVAHNTAQHQHRRNQGSDNGGHQGKGHRQCSIPRTVPAGAGSSTATARMHDADGRTTVDPNRLTRRALEV